jgi:hypothetical protein
MDVDEVTAAGEFLVGSVAQMKCDPVIEPAGCQMQSLVATIVSSDAPGTGARQPNT